MLQQEGSLCAQHCLNALLQGPYFTPVELGSLAQQMDDEERLRMAECGEESEEYQRFLQQPSGNMDDSGYFSVQVISSALEVWGLELVPYTSTEQRAREACTTPNKMQAFICNYKDHWFTIRRLGNQWFNLNSLLARPELISDTYLALFLAQLQQEGYSIFVVFGDLPECEADNLLKIKPAVPYVKVGVVPKKIDEEDLQKALAMSLNSANNENKNCQSSAAQCSNVEDDRELQKALRLSLQQFDDEDSDSEDAQLRKALKLSLECRSNTPSTPSTPCSELEREEIRRRRLAFIEKNAASCPGKSDGL